jgi:hypothetical protein
MWQAKANICDSLFDGELWAWSFDVDGQASKTIWKSSLTDGNTKCDENQADCHEQRAEAEIQPVLNKMAEFATLHGNSATLHGFIQEQRASKCAAPRATAQKLFSREHVCHFYSTEELKDNGEICQPQGPPTVGRGMGAPP